MVLDDVPGYERVWYAAESVIPVSFMVQKLKDVKAQFEGEQGSFSELVYGTDFSVSVNDGILYVTLLPAFVPPETYGEILIYRDVVLEQRLRIPSGKELPRKPLEWLLDRIVWMMQEIRRSISDVLVSVDPDSPTYIIPSITNRAGKLLGYDSDGIPTALDRPDRYPTSAFVREAYVAAVDQRSYADTFKLAGQKIDESFIRSFLCQNYHAKNWRPFSDFSGPDIISICAGFSTNDRYISGGRVAYLMGKISTEAEMSIMRLDYDGTITNIRNQFTLEGLTFLASGDEKCFYFGNQKGTVVAVNIDTGIEAVISWDLWKAACTEVCVDSSMAFYYSFPSNETTGDYYLNYTIDPNNPNGSWVSVLSPDTEIYRVLMLSHGHADRLKYLAASNGGFWETDDPSVGWTRPGSNAFLHNAYRKGLCWSEYYKCFFTFSVEPSGDVLNLYVERSDDGEIWEDVQTVVMQGSIMASSEIYGSGTVTYSEFDSRFKQTATMFADDEVGTVTIHYADQVIVMQPDMEYTRSRFLSEYGCNRGVFVKGLGITLDFQNMRYLKAAIPVVPNSTELPDDVIIIYNDNIDFIIAYDDNPDYLIVNEE